MNKNEIVIELSESDRTKLGKEEFESESLPQRVFSAVWRVEADVNSGGFTQYFFDSSPETAAFASEALQTIVAPKTAEICRRATAVAFPSGLPSDADEIQRRAAEFSEEITERLELLDQEFFAYPHDLRDLLFAYVSSIPMSLDRCPNQTTNSLPTMKSRDWQA